MNCNLKIAFNTDFQKTQGVRLEVERTYPRPFLDWDLFSRQIETIVILLLRTGSNKTADHLHHTPFPHK